MTQTQTEKRDELIQRIINNCGLSISHATMRNCDLIPVFLETLSILNPERAIEKFYGDADLDNALGDLDYGIENPYFDTDAATEVLNDLFDLLDENAPENYYFGAHIGDSSDYGFWLNEDAEVF